ncbi:MAG: hypothetical protein BGO53_05305 [Sphingobacteriales bacterium 39-19]|nr:MAG: hypothetical protein BGO53_05305 [Sphingobacteriales bacterium 39-19]
MLLSVDFSFKIFSKLNFFFGLLLWLSSCTIIKNAPRDKPYLIKNNIKIEGGQFSKIDKEAVVERMRTQFDDSAVVLTKSPLFFLDIIKRPPAFDTSAVNRSLNNMRASLFHLGFYHPQTSFDADTTVVSRDNKKVKVDYLINVGKRTLIDTVTYRLQREDLQELILNSRSKSVLKKGDPITKAAVLGEMARIVDTLRNNGYYKFSSAELRVQGDTSIAALTTISDDPFEQLQLLAEAQAQKDSPSIKLAVVLVNPEDSSKLLPYHINNIYLLPDYRPGDKLEDTINIIQRKTASGNFILRYHQPLYRAGVLIRQISFRKGDIFRQNEYYKTLNNISKTGLWQNTNIQVIELPDSNAVDLVVELIPVSKFGFEAALEASYSSGNNSANAIAGSLFGLSGNLSLTNRNIAREGIRMMHSLRAGVEFNNKSGSYSSGLINSTEFSYTNSISIPRVLNPFKKDKRRILAGETFVNTTFSYATRFNLFSLQSVNMNTGFTYPLKNGAKFTFRPFYAEFNYLFNQSDSFIRIKDANPFLRYSYNTAFVSGMGASYSRIFNNPVHLKSILKERSIKLNIEESGLTWGALPILKKYKKRYIKTDAEYKYTVNYNKTSWAFRLFAGVGIPLARDSTLPFFKQYFGGGSSSMRGWPVRGIGLGGRPLKPFAQNLFNEQTGDVQLEGNAEYRYYITRLIPNLLTLRGALFVDVGNVWNFNKTILPNGVVSDTAQFKFQNLYQQIGLSAGTGLHFDFNYVILRFDFGFRFKRPEMSYIHNGWKAPDIGFNDFLQKLFNRKYKEWRYENFNFTIGINYAF